MHRERVQERKRTIPVMAEVTGERVEDRRREYEPWADERLVLDTAHSLEDVAEVAVAHTRSS